MPKHSVRVSGRRRFACVVATMACVLLAAACMLGATPAGAAPSGTPGGAAQTAAATRAPVFAYYYLWWSRAHWMDMLGPNYPVAAKPLPLPATLDANGCNPTSRYPGNRLTDVPTALYSQDDPGFIEADVRQAAAAGLTGFAVNWSGTGT